MDDGSRAVALNGLGAKPPLAVPGTYSDVYANLSRSNQTAFDRSAQEANANQIAQARGIQNQMAMRGMQQLTQQRQNQQSLGNQRLAMNVGLLNGLLSDLYQ